MARRPTREWLEALVSGALLSGCPSTAPSQPPPSLSTAPADDSQPPEMSVQAPSSAAPSTTPPPTTPPPTSAANTASTKRVELAAFEPSSCKGPAPARAEVACVDVQRANGTDERARSPQNLANVRPACAVDGIVVFQDGPGKISELARSGQPCAATPNQNDCEQRLENIAFPRDAGFAEEGARTFLVVAQAGVHRLISTREQLVGLVGAVDSKQDAAALLWLAGWGGACSKLKPQGTGFVLPTLKLGFLCPPMIRGQPGAEPIPNFPEGYQKDGSYRVQVDHGGKLKVSYLGGADPKHSNIACGRRPSGIELGAGCGWEVGEYLAASASLEAAAVMAFELLASELSAHGAPASLVARCQAAADDERRHTLLMVAAARRYGVEPPLPELHARPLPTLLELAHENVVEGCVRETWGALSAALQAHTARDAELAALYASIAPDELAHAELSWDIHEWLAERTGSREHLLRLAQLARAELLAQQTDPSPAVATLAGSPTQAAACALIRALAA